MREWARASRSEAQLDMGAIPYDPPSYDTNNPIRTTDETYNAVAYSSLQRLTRHRSHARYLELTRYIP